MKQSEAFMNKRTPLLHMTDADQTPPEDTQASLRLGLDLGGTKIEAAALSGDGVIRARQRISTPTNYDAAIAAVRDIVAATEAQSGPCASIGVGHPGSISPITGKIRNANSTWLNGRALNTDLAQALSRPVRLANDADCFALSEAVDGAGADAAIVFGVILGTGVGGGVVINKMLLSGAQKIAGEWGHNPLPWPRGVELEPGTCWCGKAGCIETWLSGPGFARHFAAACPKPPEPQDQPLSAKDIIAAADAGDADAITARDAYVDRLARALASVLNIIDAHVVVLGGGLSNIDALYAPVQARLGRHLFSDHVVTKIVRNVHGDSSGVRGAAWLWPPEPTVGATAETSSSAGADERP